MNHWQETSEGLLWQDVAHGTWAVRWAGVTPGLYCKPAGQTNWAGPLLGALALTAQGRGEAGNLNDACLTQIDVVRDRVELSFQPPGWHETSVRFAWSPAGPGQFDLQVQASTRSIDILSGVEVGVISSTGTGEPGTPSKWLVAHRDEAAALRALDGRQAAWLNSQVGFEVDSSVTGHGEDREWPPTLLAGLPFLETAHPFDISRRYRSTDGQAQLTWALGFDMERGTILRARLRGRLVAPNEQTDWTALHNWQSAFMAEPLPLDR